MKRKILRCLNKLDKIRYNIKLDSYEQNRRTQIYMRENGSTWLEAYLVTERQRKQLIQKINESDILKTQMESMMSECEKSDTYQTIYFIENVNNRIKNNKKSIHRGYHNQHAAQEAIQDLIEIYYTDISKWRRKFASKPEYTISLQLLHFKNHEEYNETKIYGEWTYDVFIVEDYTNIAATSFLKRLFLREEDAKKWVENRNTAFENNKTDIYQVKVIKEFDEVFNNELLKNED